MSATDLPHLARLVDDAMNRHGWSARDVSTRSREVDPARRGVNHGTVADIREGSWGPKGPTQRTLQLLALTLDINSDEVLAAAGRSKPQPRAMPDDFLYLTPSQWAVIRETARLFRAANDTRETSVDTGASAAGVPVTTSDN